MLDSEIVKAIIGAAALVLALSAIWMKGIKPSAQWVGGVVDTLRELVDLVRDMRDFLMRERDEMRHEIRELRTDVDELTLAAMADSVTLHATQNVERAEQTEPGQMSKGARA